MAHTAECNLKINILATFAHEVLMGAYRPEELPDRARLALERAGEESLTELEMCRHCDQMVVDPCTLARYAEECER